MPGMLQGKAHHVRSVLRQQVTLIKFYLRLVFAAALQATSSWAWLAPGDVF
jgi:hypothetical protein